MSRFEDLVESINQKTPSVKLGILFGIIAFMVVAYWYLFWSSKAEELKAAKIELQKQEATLNEYRNIEEELPKFELEFKRLSKEFEVAARKLPEEKEIPSLIDSVYAAVSASGLVSDTFAPKPEVKKDIYAEVPVEMKVFGSYYDIATFFDRISKLPRIVNIKDLNLQRKDIKGDKVVLNASFTTLTFRLLPVSDVEAAKGKAKGKNRKKDIGTNKNEE
ncbi:MAG TPA: type 4a pilus biogenesis protein PilO [Thermodesulfobacteriota bacterium]|nr:type 4a pilus biogenesis protein PilO [Thermodesulfobacteriota bacterium]